uniref:Uncharacterized protein n=1 Tax=Arundo donax TaxID=35708 RepID=A0A0A9C3I2_ARUDO
MPNGIKTICAD